MQKFLLKLVNNKINDNDKLKLKLKSKVKFNVEVMIRYKRIRTTDWKVMQFYWLVEVPQSNSM